MKYACTKNSTFKSCEVFFFLSSGILFPSLSTWKLTMYSLGPTFRYPLLGEVYFCALPQLFVYSIMAVFLFTVNPQTENSLRTEFDLLVQSQHPAGIWEKLDFAQMTVDIHIMWHPKLYWIPLPSYLGTLYLFIHWGLVFATLLGYWGEQWRQVLTFQGFAPQLYISCIRQTRRPC